MKKRVEIIKILKICSGHFHCWVNSSVGIIRKPNSAVSNYLWDIFYGRVKESPKPEEIKVIEEVKPQINWWRKAVNWIKKLFLKQ